MNDSLVMQSLSFRSRPLSHLTLMGFLVASLQLRLRRSWNCSRSVLVLASGGTSYLFSAGCFFSKVPCLFLWAFQASLSTFSLSCWLKFGPPSSSVNTCMKK